MREQVKEILAEIMGPLVEEGAAHGVGDPHPGMTGSFRKERAVRAG